MFYILSAILSIIAILAIIDGMTMKRHVRYKKFKKIKRKKMKPFKFGVKIDEFEVKPREYTGVLRRNLYNSKIESLTSTKYGNQSLDNAEIKQFVQGFLNFSCSEQMKLGNKEIVIAELFVDKVIYEQLVGHSVIEEIRISKIMALKLYSEDFNIISKSSEIQAIIDVEKTTWLWDVTPLKHGIKYLELIVTAKMKIKGSDSVYDLPIHTKKIQVKINRPYILMQFWNKNWQWIIGTLIGSGVLVVILKTLGLIKG